MIKKHSVAYPGRILLFVVFASVVVGTIILSLPICLKQNINFLDLLFTSASAACVTGLETIPLDKFTTIGQIVILLLIQIGGLGLMTLTLLVASFFINLGLSTQMIAGQILEIDNLKHVKRMFTFTFLFTALVEILAAIIFIFNLKNKLPLSKCILFSLYQSISSFCNAGIILPEAKEFIYSNNLILIISSILVIVGGIGFIPWYEILSFFKQKIFLKKRAYLSLHTRVVLYLTAALTLISIITFLILEYNNTLQNFSLGQKIIYAIFNGSGFRSAGFLTVGFDNLQMATILMIMILCSIGSSPGSTGSGIKTTVFGIFLATVRSVIRAKKNIKIFNRCIIPIQVYKALTIITLSLSWILLSSFILMITENSFTFLDIVFESTSAFMNLGISSGITSKLSSIGKGLITLSMIMGRVGSLTVALSFIKSNRETKEFAYPEEKMMLT